MTAEVTYTEEYLTPTYGRGGQRRDMTKSYISYRDKGDYASLYGDDEFVSRNWPSVVAKIVTKRQGQKVLGWDFYVRKANPGEEGRNLRQGPTERPHFDIPMGNNRRLSHVGGNRKQIVQLRYFTDDQGVEWCIWSVPNGYRIESR